MRARRVLSENMSQQLVCSLLSLSEFKLSLVEFVRALVAVFTQQRTKRESELSHLAQVS